MEHYTLEAQDVNDVLFLEYWKKSVFKETLSKTEQSIIRFLEFRLPYISLLRANSVWCPQLSSPLSRRRQAARGTDAFRYRQQKLICKLTPRQRAGMTASGDDKPLAFLGSQETEPGKLTCRALGRETPSLPARPPAVGQRAPHGARPRSEGTGSRTGFPAQPGLRVDSGLHRICTLWASASSPYLEVSKIGNCPLKRR